MSNLGPQNINLTYGSVLNIAGGLTSSGQQVSDGFGNTSDLNLATSGSNIPNLTGGVAGSVPFQLGTNVTGFLGPGLAGQVISNDGAGNLVWVSAPASTSATNLSGGSAGAVVYQSALNTTAFVAGTTGQVLQSNGTSAPAWVNQSTLSAGHAVNLSGGTLGEVPYQSGVGTTSFTGAGVAGQLLESVGSGAPIWSTSFTIGVGGQVNFAPLTSAPASPQLGDVYYDSTLLEPLQYDGSVWKPLGGAASGGGSDQIFFQNGQTVTTNFTLTTNFNAGTFGPVSINSGVTVTVPTGATWTVV